MLTTGIARSVRRAQPEPHDWKLTHNPALDGLRAVAISLVILSHAHAPGVEGAFFGVDLFFVLSGYLITTLLLIEIGQTGRINLWRFYRRRFFRLMPALLAFLAAYCLIAPLLWPDSGDWYQDALVSGLYLADYGIAFFDIPNSLLHMWSLSVEEHYYLLWPLTLLALTVLLPRGALWPWVGALFLLAWGWRVLWVWQGQQFYEIFFRFDTRATGLLAGSLLAILLRECPAWFQRLRGYARWGLWLIALTPLWIGLEWDDMNAMTWAMTLVELTAMALLLTILPAPEQAAPRGWARGNAEQVPRGRRILGLSSLLRCKCARYHRVSQRFAARGTSQIQARQRAGTYAALPYAVLSHPALVKIGQLSYAIYLWHYPILRVLRAHLDWPWVVLLGGVLSVLLAQLSWVTIERWGRAWRDRKPLVVGRA